MQLTYPSDDASMLIREYRRFIVLKIGSLDIDATYLSPSPKIDDVWHMHILDTCDYAAFQDRIGFRLQHNPDNAIDSHAGNAARDVRLENTRKQYEDAFGPFDAASLRIWHPEASDIGSEPREDSRRATFQVAAQNRITLWEFTLPLNLTFGELKSAIYYAHNIPPEKQRHIFNGIEAKDSDKLSDRGVTDGSVVYLTYRLRGC